MSIGCTSEGENVIHDIFDIPNTVFRFVLGLVMQFTSVRYNMVDMKNILVFLTGSSACIIANKYILRSQSVATPYMLMYLNYTQQKSVQQ